MVVRYRAQTAANAISPLIYFEFVSQCIIKMLREDYKFGLAFENSLCTDYVSDKLYCTALENGVLPVVYGEADYRAYAPS
jgi:hypothetical protein